MKAVIGSLLCAVSVLSTAPEAGAQMSLPTASTPPPATDSQGAPAPQTPASTIVERVLVRVNGEIFTQSQLTNRQINVLRDLKQTASASTNLEAELALLTPDILVRAVDQLLIAQHGRELGITFTDAQFKSAIDNIKKQNNLDD